LQIGALIHIKRAVIALRPCGEREENFPANIAVAVTKKEPQAKYALGVPSLTTTQRQASKLGGRGVGGWGVDRSAWPTRPVI